MIGTDSSLNFTDIYLEQSGLDDFSHTPSEPSADWPSFAVYLPAHALPRDYPQVLGELVQLKCEWVMAQFVFQLSSRSRTLLFVC